ncbi:hypothetical protein EVJ58_g10743 [Rhodofomes roseus]|uniref:RNA-directed DNA polymerase n=1 Tax=Rhodofomes roseus TaxID=34475 RepID=A0A4Y9XLZ2_9APHY|nr:hypothetical protein EVJ58_g10743 [Rhodofomes roseus]
MEPDVPQIPPQGPPPAPVAPTPQAQDHFATLAASFNPQTYGALEALLRDLDGRVQGFQLTPAAVRDAVREGLASTTFSIPPAPPNPPQPRQGQLKVDLPHFSGKETDDVPMLFRNDAMRWYTARKKQLGRAFSWHELRTELQAKYDTPLRVESLCEQLRALSYKGTLSRYVATFREIEVQIPEDDMTFGDRKSHFLSHLPVEYAKDIRRDKPKNVEELYHSARELERLEGLQRGPNSHSVSNQRKRSKGFAHHSTSSHASHTSSQSSPNPYASSLPVAPPPSTAPVPMDLDVMEMQPPKRKEGSSMKGDLHVLDGPDEPETSEDELAAELLSIDLSDEPTPQSRLPTYAIQLLACVGQTSGHLASSIIDTGAAYCYIKRSTAVAAKLNLFPIERRSVQGVGSAATTAVANFAIKIGGWRKPMCAYVLDEENLRYDMIIGQDWLKKYNAQPDWPTHSWFLTDPHTCQIVRLFAATTPGSARMGCRSCSTSSHGHTFCSSSRRHAHAQQSPLIATPLDLFVMEDYAAEKAYSVFPEQMEQPVLQGLKAKLKGFGEKLRERAKRRFPRLFRERMGPPPADRWAHDIKTGDAKPRRIPGRPLSPPEHEEMRKFVDEGLRDGIIEPSRSPWSSPPLLVPKKDGTSRPCIDFRYLNDVTEKDAYPLPRIDDSYQVLAGARHFTALDLMKGFWQIPLTQSARAKTAFTCRYGHFQFRVMPFGLCNAPATFQAYMNHILRDALDSFVMVYMDDIIIFSRTKEDHVRHVEWVLSRLDDEGLVLSEKKCVWAAEELLYLGHIVNSDGIRVNPDKVKAIIDWPRPANITEVRGFLNIAGYYRRFIKGFAKLADVLYDLLKGNPKKRAAIEWSSACETSFTTLKSRLTSTPLLSYPKPYQTYVIDTDASGHAIGGILQQSQQSLKEGKEPVDRYLFKEADLRPVAYESRRMSPAEQRYSAQEREMLAIDHCLQKWRGYVEGSPIVVRTDHESLKYFLTQKHLGRRLARFADRISQFDVQIRYRPGSHQLAADALSRREGLPEVTDADTSGALLAMPAENQDSVEVDRSALFETMLRWKEDLQRDPSAEPSRRGFLHHDGHLYRAVNLGDGDVYLRVPTSLDAAFDTIRSVHVDIGHLGTRAVVAALRTRVWMPNVTELVEWVIRRCDACQFTRREAPVPQPLHPMPRTEAFSRWALDFIGPLPRTKRGNMYILTTMDHGTDQAHADPLPRRSQTSVLTMIRFLTTTYGKPASVLTDNGEEFMSYAVQNYLQRLQIEHIHTSPYHPQTNGRLEKFNHLLGQILARFTAPDRQDEWDDFLPDALLAYRAHVSRSHGRSPFFLTFGREPRLPHEPTLDTLRRPPTDAEIEMLQHRRVEHIQNLERMRTEANARALGRLENEANRREGTYRERGFGIGDLVLRRSESPTKLHPRWDGPFIVHDLTDRNTYQLRTRNGYILRTLYNGERLKRYFPATPAPPLWYSSAELQRRDAKARIQRDINIRRGHRDD